MKAQASSLAEEVGFLGVTVDNKLKFESQIKKNISQSEPANHCSEEDEEVPSFKAGGKAL